MLKTFRLACKMAFLNIFRNPLRSAMTIGIITLGISGLSIARGFVEDIFFQLRESTIYMGLGHVQVFKEGYFKDGRQSPKDFLIDLPADLDSLRKQWNLDVLTPRLQFMGTLQKNGVDFPVFGDAGTPAGERQVNKMYQMISGENFADSSEYELLVGEGTAKALSIQVGETVSLLVPTFEGALNTLDFTVRGVFRSNSEMYDDNAVRIPLSAAQTLMNTNQIHNLVGLFARTELTDRGVRKIKPADSKLEVKSWREMATYYNDVVVFFKMQFGVLEAAIFLMVVLVVSQTLSTSFYERIREIGVVGSLGFRRSQIFYLFLLEALILAMISIAIGAVVTFVLAKAINSVGISMPPPPNLAIGFTALTRVNTLIYLQSAAVALVLTALSAVWPLWNILRRPIVDQLREDR